MSVRRIRIVVSPTEAGWILGKFASHLVAELSARGLDVDQAATPSADADVNHWIYFAYYTPEKRPGIHTVMITHIDHLRKLQHLQDSVAFTQCGICLSTDTRDMLIRRGIPSSWLSVILPAHDPRMTPRRIRLGLTTRLYGDGRKGEDKLRAVARTMRLENFHFDIIGGGWAEVIEDLRRAGATVRWADSSGDADLDYETNLAWVPEFDYYLYLGEDEGSMGLLDAISVGVKTIATPQGFHRDLPNGVTHPIWTAADLAAVLREIEHERVGRISEARALTWARYADEHLRLWNDLAEGRPVSASPPVGTPARSAWHERYAFYLRPYLRKLRARLK